MNSASNDYKTRENISVALATFNGERFIKEQLESIIPQLINGDEIIISDDGSTDSTVDIIKRYSQKYSYIKVYHNDKSNKGVIGNFENALKRCKNTYIFLSDQDDIWLPNKVEVIINSFNVENATLVLHNAYIFDSKNNLISNVSMKEKIGSSTKLFKILIKNPFIGCCMSFKKTLLNVVLPFPNKNDISIHDWWIGICAVKTSKVYYCDEKLIMYRIHDSNTLGFHKTSFKYKLQKRLKMIKCIYKNRRRFK